MASYSALKDTFAGSGALGGHAPETPWGTRVWRPFSVYPQPIISSSGEVTFVADEFDRISIYGQDQTGSPPTGDYGSTQPFLIEVDTVFGAQPPEGRGLFSLSVYYYSASAPYAGGGFTLSGGPSSTLSLGGGFFSAPAEGTVATLRYERTPSGQTIKYLGQTVAVAVKIPEDAVLVKIQLSGNYNFKIRRFEISPLTEPAPFWAGFENSVEFV